MNLLQLIAVIFSFAAPLYAQEFEQEDAQPVEPPCAHASMRGRWVGPEDEMNMDEECHGTMQSSEVKFDYDDSDKFKRGNDKCKIFQKANEVVVDCGKDEVEKYHRYNKNVNK